MAMVDFIGSRVASARNRLSDRLFERKLGIDTLGRKEVNVGDSVPYSTFAYWSIFRVLERLELADDDVFVDFGCGKGRVVCAAAMRPLRKAIGVDIDQQLCDEARQNASRMRHRRAPIEIINAPAQDFDSRECTALFFFNPFGPGTLHAVLRKVIEGHAQYPRKIRMVYVNPLHDRVFAEFNALERYDSWPLVPHGRLKFDVSFWRCRD
jgi:SAM-dependent methyltransferase